MRVLVTGGAGKIGRALVPALIAHGHNVSVFEVAVAAAQSVPWHCEDVRDLASLRAVLRDSGVEAVLHLAAIPWDRPGREGSADVLSVNVQGTINVLLASEEADVERVIHFSSVNALGCVGGRRLAQYLPIDDSHPPTPQTAYQLSKHLAVQACRSFSDRKGGLTTICLRPVYVADPVEYQRTGGGVARGCGVDAQRILGLY